MLKNVGLSRVIFISILLGFNIFFLAGAYLYVMPEKITKSQELAASKSTVQAKYAEIVQLREDFSLLRERLKEFSALELSGFFENQNRLLAQEKISSFGLKTELLKVSMDMESGEIVASAKAAEAGHVLLKSPFAVKIDAQDDLDVVYFLKLMQEQFSGVVEFRSVDIKRVQNLDAPMLRLIGGGTPSTLVKANVEMNWVTMPSKKDVQ